MQSTVHLLLKANANMIKEGYQMDGWSLQCNLHAKLWAHPKIGVKFCADYTNALDRTINWGLPCVYACKKITHAY